MHTWTLATVPVLLDRRSLPLSPITSRVRSIRYLLAILAATGFATTALVDSAGAMPLTN